MQVRAERHKLRPNTLPSLDKVAQDHEGAVQSMHVHIKKDASVPWGVGGGLGDKIKCLHVPEPLMSEG